MDKFEISKQVINNISEKLHKEYKEIKWDLPQSIGKEDVITKGVELHAQIQLIYKIIHEIEWAVKEGELKCKK